jgi:hypothetical protein
MIIILHVAIATLSLICTTYAYLRPTSSSTRASYALIALTVASGFYLVWSEPAQMLHTCMTGLAYLAVVSVGVFATRRKRAVLDQEQA